MSLKMLYILNIANKVNSFSYTSMLAAQSLDIEYHIAGNWNYANNQERKIDEERYGIHIHQIDFIRTPYHIGNIKAYKQLGKIIEKEKFNVIHCNTPIGGVVGRLLGRKYKINTVIYQAHGFHFFNGAPKLNWLIYYPIEKWLSKYTDALITINKEDFNRAHKFKLKKNGSIFYVPGVGLNPAEFVFEEDMRNRKREELGVNENNIVLFSAGDLVKRKNYSVAIEAIAKTKNKKLQYYICGMGPEEKKLKVLSKRLGVNKQVHFLGFRSDIKELLVASDIFLFTTLQEGLPRSLSEAMAAGLPCIVSKIRGNVDLIENGIGGILCDAKDIDAFSEAINNLSADESLRRKMRIKNREKIMKFDNNASSKALLSIYRKLLIHEDNRDN